ncbi:MAG: hypothetical protein FWC02_00500 [Firmicutes bacterium]|nr:hypothetical protein [Bacillota bacterium]
MKKLLKIFLSLMLFLVLTFSSGCFFLPRVDGLKNFQFDFRNNVMTWDEVEGATSFRVYQSEQAKLGWSHFYFETVTEPVFCVYRFDEIMLSVVAISDRSRRNSPRQRVWLSRHTELPQTNIVVNENGRVSWNAIDYSEGYVIRLQSIPYPYVDFTFDTNETNFDINEHIGEHCIEIVWGINVTAISTGRERASTGRIYSNSTSEMSRYPLGERIALITPILRFENNQVRWQKIYHSKGFNVILNGECLEVELWHGSTDFNMGMWIFPEFEVGSRNTIAVRALASEDSNALINSELSNEVYFYVNRLDPPLDVYVRHTWESGGRSFMTIGWNEVEGASWYEIVLTGRRLNHTMMTWSLDFFSPDLVPELRNHRGVVNIQVRAIGRGKWASSGLSQVLQITL